MRVPQIDTPLLLDFLLGLVILLFVPFGIRRGVAKEAMVSAGILLGATLAERFSSAWGSEIAALLNLGPSAAHFTAAVLILFGCTFLLGYGGGAALGALRPGTLSRLSGGLLAAFNAALLLSFLLGWIESILQQGAALDDGIISVALVRQADVLLLYAAGVLLGLTVIGWIVNAARSRRQPHGAPEPPPGAMPARQRPVRLSPAADAGKYEPDAEIPRSGRFGPGVDATAPLSATRSEAPRANGAAGSRAANGHAASPHAGDTTSLAAYRAPDSPDDTVWAAWDNPGTASPPRAASQWPVSPAVGVTEDERCAVCHARVGARDVFCPECGATL